MEIKIEYKDGLLVEDAAKLLNKPKMTLYRWVEANKLVGVRLGGILFIPLSEVERLRKMIAAGDQPAA